MSLPVARVYKLRRCQGLLKPSLLLVRKIEGRRELRQVLLSR